jgi:hypothetical protein
MNRNQEQGKDTAPCGESTPELAAAVAAMGALPMPAGPDTAAADNVRSVITAAIGEAKPARDGLLVSLAQSVKDRAEHDHDTAADWDWYCLNLSGYMGDRMGSVLRRLVDAETERDTLRARVAELAAAAGDGSTRTVDEDPIAYSLTPEALHAASGAVIETPTRSEDVAPQAQKLRGLLARQRAAVEDPHDSELHHDYRVGRDLPEVTAWAGVTDIAPPGEVQHLAATGLVGYRQDQGRLLHCLMHKPAPASRYADFHEVTAEDLDDGGMCVHPRCGRDLLASWPAAEVTP